MMMRAEAVARAYETFSPALRAAVDRAVDAVVAARREGQRVVVCIGGGEHVRSGATTLVAELMHRGIIDGVCTTAGVIGHELAGVLEKIKRIDATERGISHALLRGGKYLDVSVLPPDILEQFQREIDVDISLYRSLLGAPGEIVTRAAGGGAYPTGLRTAMLAKEILVLAQACRIPFEQMGGYGADPMTMIGAGARLGIPVIAAVSQLAGCGGVGLAVGDSIPVSERAHRVSRMMGTAAVVLRSTPAFPECERDACEVYRGDGIWEGWQGRWTWSRADVTTISIEDGAAAVPSSRAGEAAAHSRDITIAGDPGILWPILAVRIAAAMGIDLEFISCGSLPENEAVREWIVNSIHPADRDEIVRSHRGLA